MTYEKPDPTAALTVVCYPTGGASLATADGHVWCGSTRLNGWHIGEGVEGHARYFLTVTQALQFARGCGWVGE
jgi:hypothetical protein